MATIYKITNIKNNKIYIGKTIRRPSVRWKEHLRSYKTANTNSALYNAFKTDGIENFTFEILKENIPNGEIDEYEQLFIKEYNTQNKEIGYNIAPGGNGGRTTSILSEDKVNEIYSILLDINNLQSFSEIGTKYGVSESVISRINTGETWYSNRLTYPLRKYNVTGLTISRNLYKQIIQDILNSQMSLQSIQKKYNLSENQITAINQGKQCYNSNNIYYKNIYKGTFPIRQTNKKINIDVNILYDIIFTKLSFAKIGKKYNIKGNTLQYIANGKRHKELTVDFLLPLRDNIEKNQVIFKNLYPNFEKKEE